MKTSIYNKDKLKRYFSLEVKRFTALAKHYENAAALAGQNIKNNIVRWEYASGGETMSWGYYNPSPILDLTVGGCNRGRILKRITQRSKPSYRYGYDGNGKLIFIEILFDYFKRGVIFEYEDKFVRGIDYLLNDSKTEVVSITEIYYDDNGRIMGFEQANTVNSPNIHEIFAQVYSYGDDGLYRADDFDFLKGSDIEYDSDELNALKSHLSDIIKDMYNESGCDEKPDFKDIFQHGDIISCTKYMFTHDSEGFLSSYTAQSYAEDLLTEFQITKKRKV